jgi:hypothetical protein
MEFIAPYISLNWKSHIVWGLFYFETTLILLISSLKLDPTSGRIFFFFFFFFPPGGGVECQPCVRPGIRGTQVKSSVRMKKTQESSKWLFLGNLIP